MKTISKKKQTTLYARRYEIATEMVTLHELTCDFSKLKTEIEAGTPISTAINSSRVKEVKCVEEHPFKKKNNFFGSCDNSKGMM